MVPKLIENLGHVLLHEPNNNSERAHNVNKADFFIV